MPRIAIVDVGIEDEGLLECAFAEAGADVLFAKDAEGVASADGIVLAGSHAFAHAITSVREAGLEAHLKAAIVAKKPFLGINVGMHLLFSVGREIEPGRTGNHVVDGLGLRPGSCPPLPDVDPYGFEFKLPHVGTGAVERDARCRTPLLEGVDDGAEFYFDHTFVAPTGPWVQAWSTYSITFPAVVDFGRTCFGVQFAPEHSGDAGMRLLSNFVSVCIAAEGDEPVLVQGPSL